MFIYILIILVTTIIFYFKNKFTYWKNKNVPYLYPTIPFGNFQSFLHMNKSVDVQVRDMYIQFKKLGVKHAGYYIINKPVYMPIDLDLIKRITTKDFEYFNEKPFYSNETHQPISLHLFTMGGDRWRTLRQKITPTFTSGKMKMMFETLLNCRVSLLETITELAEKREAMDVKEIASKFTTDVIGSVAFGVDCNSFNNPDAEFRKYGKVIMNEKFWRQIKVLFSFAFSGLASKMGIVLFPRATEEFFTKVVKDIVKFREENNTTRNDFMQLLINIKNKGHADLSNKESNPEGKLTINEIVGQSFLFFLAGFETSATTMTFCLYELSQNPEIQDRVREEIHGVLKKYNGEIIYEALFEMKYMKQVIEETLRKYPPIPTIDRKCSKNYQVPNTDLLIEKGTFVAISTLGLHRDPEYFPDPDKFDPDRFSEENISKIKPYTYMPFGEGPRICIGLRFGFMQTQVGLITFLQNFKYTLDKRMNQNGDDVAVGFILSLKDNIVLDITKTT